MSLTDVTTYATATTSSNYATTATVCTNSTATISGNYVTTTPNYTITWGDSTTAGDYYSNYSNKITKQYVEELVDDYIKEKDNKNMANDFSFGAYNTNSIRMSLYGMAIKNKAGKWVAYDKQTHRLMDVEVLNFNINSKDIFYKIPVALDKVEPGNIILHNDKLVFVEVARDDGKFEVVDPYEGTAIIILAPISPFGFNYLIQIVCLMDVLPEASAENPFGSFLPFILGGDGNNIPLIMAMTGKSFDDLDPMMMMMLCGKGDMSTYVLMQMLTKKKNKKEKQKDFVNKFNEAKNRHAMYGASIEDMDE